MLQKILSHLALTSLLFTGMFSACILPTHAVASMHAMIDQAWASIIGENCCSDHTPIPSNLSIQEKKTEFKESTSALPRNTFRNSEERKTPLEITKYIPQSPEHDRQHFIWSETIRLLI